MAEKQVRNCSVVVGKLIDEVLVRGTVKVYQFPRSDRSDLVSSEDDPVTRRSAGSLQSVPKCPPKIPLNRPRKKSKRIRDKLSVYTEINDINVITEVKCKRFRKRKLGNEEDGTDIEMTVKNVVGELVEHASSTCSASLAENINYDAPGSREAELVKEFCKENGFAHEDYSDLKGLFTFGTLRADDSSAEQGSRNRTRRKAWGEPLRKMFRQRSVDNQKKGNGEDARQGESLNGPYPRGLEKIENEKIRKILEDFGRLSKRQESRGSNEERITSAGREKKIQHSTHGRNSITAKPLNLCKKDRTDADQLNELQKMDHSSEKEPAPNVPASILKRLLHSSAPESEVAGKDSKTQTTNVTTVTNKAGRCIPGTARMTKTQQPRMNSLPSDGVKAPERKETIQQGIQLDNARWINDPNVILSKIKKLKRDIVYLGLLAEEKEKERVAILRFKRYKESILKKIFANEAAANRETVNTCRECSGHVASCNENNQKTEPAVIPKLIHPVKVPFQTVNVPSAPLIVNTVQMLYPTTVSLLGTFHPRQCVQSNPSIKVDSWSQIGVNTQVVPCQDPSAHIVASKR